MLGTHFQRFKSELPVWGGSGRWRRTWLSVGGCIIAPFPPLEAVDGSQWRALPVRPARLRMLAGITALLSNRSLIRDLRAWMGRRTSDFPTFTEHHQLQIFQTRQRKDSSMS